LEVVVFHPLYDHLIRRDFLEGIDAKPLAELRAMRAECEQVESALSFSRRVLHGRLDIVASERERRRSGEGGRDLDDLVDQLPSILADHQARPASPQTRLVLTPAPDCVTDELVELLDSVAGPATLAHLSDLGDDEVDQLVDKLAGLERQLSEARRGLHERIDTLQQEITSRYERGEATIETLLG
jgi:hypothetical protein